MRVNIDFARASDLYWDGRFSESFRLRIGAWDMARRLNPDTIMPPYYRTDGFARVAPGFRDKPILSAEQIEDVVAFLMTLRE